MLASIVCAVALSIQNSDQDQARTWEFRAGRWEQVVPVLEKELGQQVQINSRLRDEVVVGRFVGKTKLEMIKAFADATLTSWSDQNGVIMIQPDGRRREEEEKARRKKRTEQFQKNLNKVLGQVFNQELADKAIKAALDFNKSQSETSEYDYRKIQ